MAGKIFINYRRANALAGAGRLQDRLAEAFGKKNLFMDVDHIPAGVDFVTYLSQQVAECDVFLAVMAPGWLDARDDAGQRRIDDPADFVAIEIAAALARGDKIRVIPVLLDGTPMPKADELPEALKPLARRNAVDVRNAQFGRDAEVLIGKIREALKADKPAPKRWPLIAGAAGVVAAGYFAAALLGAAPLPWPVGGGPDPAVIAEQVKQAELKRLADARAVDDAAAAKRKDDELVATNRFAAADRKRIADDIAAKTKADAEAKRVADAAATKKADDERAAKAAAEAKALAETKAALERAAALKAEAERRATEKLEAEFKQLSETGTADVLAGFALLNPAFAARAEPIVARKKTAEEDAARRNDPIAALKPGSGQSAQDCWFDGVTKRCGPEMVVVPGGTFTMGSPDNEPERFSNEQQVKVSISQPFAVGKFAVTFDEWDACVADGGCKSYKPDDRGWGRGKRPVINVNLDDAKGYVAWLSRKTGKTYRLLSEAEREYVARAGTTSPFWWGKSITPKQANYYGSAEPYRGGGTKGEYREKTVPVDSFEANPWGLYNVHGNVWDWTEDCWNDTYSGNPGTGAARTSGDCSGRVLRGGSWISYPQYLRSAFRFRISTVGRDVVIGFRVGRTLTP
jgi:formylglycine-generating enzyme required for sulfatase activity